MPVSFFPVSVLALASVALTVAPTQSSHARQTGVLDANGRAMAALQAKLKRAEARLAVTGLGPSGLTIQDPEPRYVWRYTDYVATEDSRAETLRRAALVLDEAGFGPDAERLRELMELIAADADPDERAKRLLAGDIQDRALRVGIITLAADGYRSMDWEANAAALDWFASIGRVQASGEVPELGVIPEAARSEGVSIMDRMVELVLGASAAHHVQGHELAADACMRLGRFYVERSLGAFADSPSTGRKVNPNVPVESAGAPALREIGYGGGDEPAPAPASASVPVLGPVPGPRDLTEVEMRTKELERKALQLKLEALEARLATLLDRRDELIQARKDKD